MQRSNSHLVIFGLIILLAVVNGSANAQSISKKEAITDFYFLNEAVIHGHGANYNPKISVNINGTLKDVLALKSDSISIPEFRYFLGRALCEIGCLHTSIKKIPLDSQMNKPVYFPIPVLLVEKALYIDHFESEENEKYIGQRIQEINGLPSAFFVERLLHYLSGDGRGSDDSYETQIAMLYAPKLISYYLDYPVKFKIKTAIGSFTLDASQKANYRYRSIIPMQKQDKVLEGSRAYYFKRDSLPLLRIEKFVKEDIEFWPKIMTILSEENAPCFVVDLRGNGGGNRDAGSELMRFLTNDNFSYSILQPKLKPKPYLNGQGKRYYRFSKLKYNVGRFTHKNSTELGKSFRYTFKPQAANYKGQIIVMIDGMTASTSTMLTTWLDKYSNAIFVGRRTGGGYNGNNGGVFPRITLPCSKTIIRFPAYRLVLDDDYRKENGLKPDFEVNYSVEDWLGKKDKDWEAVLKVVKGVNNPNAIKK